MIQSWFANALARPRQASTFQEELKAIKVAYDRGSGLPPPATFDAFNNHVRASLGCIQWTSFLHEMRLGFRVGLNPRATFAAALRQAVVDSWEAGYHNSGPRPNPPRPPPVVRSAGGSSGEEGQLKEVVGRGGGIAREQDGPCFLQWSTAPLGQTSRPWRQ